MSSLPTPAPTPAARRRLAETVDRLDAIEHALLATVDGHRNVIELESLARALHLDPDALERLRRSGLITFEHSDLS